MPEIASRAAGAVAPRRLSRRRALALAVLAVPLLGAPARGQPRYPDKPIRLIVPYAPGGGADIVGRVLGRCMGQGLGQPIVVENRGAGGTIGADAAASVPPGRSEALVAVTALIEAMKADGTVRCAFDAHGMEAAAVAPPGSHS